ncbi:hypothetical protein LEN26_019262 [Aphanomyces euteiches]|nr:hypothetical protein LEN26_019262 [Aphanomyces euteiches]KAH9110994.1 hypothetical protein AeMF1_014355 [Aphanomyces euteiches]KAH9197524.1 hypothetical protein AeNC1_000474 [Aphanomyces euteiches]
MQTLLRRAHRRTPPSHRVVLKKGPVEYSLQTPGDFTIKHVTATPSSQCMLYTTHMRNAHTGTSWVVHRRFTDFVVLRTKLIAVLEPFHCFVSASILRLKNLPFPKRVAFVSQRVVRRRELAFLDFLQGVHALLLDSANGLDEHLMLRCFSIFRGFLGSMDVLHPSHADYFCLIVTPQDTSSSKKQDVPPCGRLDPVDEEDSNDEDCTSDGDVSCTLNESSRSCMSFDDSSRGSIALGKKESQSAGGVSKAYSMFFPRRLTLCQQAARS